MKNPLNVIGLAATLVFAILFPACGSTRTVIADAVPSEAPTLSGVSAAVGQALIDNEQNPEGPAKEAVRGNLTVAKAGLPAPAPADAKAASKLSGLFFAGQMLAAMQLQQEHAGELARLRAQMDRERAEAKAKLEAEIARIKSEAEEKTRRLIGSIFFGGAALALVAGVLCLTVFRGVPMIGPKLIAGCFVLAGVLSGTGIAILKAMQSPWIVYTGLGIAGAVVVAVVVLAYVNHWHGKDAAK